MLFEVQWYWWALLVLFAAAAVILWRKALIAGRERRERLKKEAAIWQRDYDLRQNYSVLTLKKIENAPQDELLHGAAMNIQVKLENEKNMNDAFGLLPTEKKYIYTLEYFDEDAKNALSRFFKNNGAPLTALASPALKELGFEKEAALVDALYPMYDEDSDVSVDNAAVAKADAEFAEVYDSAALCNAAAKYIAENAGVFAD